VLYINSKVAKLFITTGAEVNTLQSAVLDKFWKFTVVDVVLDCGWVCSTL